jgi:glycosyltransferase involved in cell wall biosynthesis
MKILQLVKYYYPSKGGMESVVKNLSEGLVNLDDNINVTVYANNHKRSLKSTSFSFKKLFIIIEKTSLFFKSQPLNFRYKLLKKLISESDIIHHHYPYPNIEISLLMHKNLLANKKFIITWHANIENSRWFFFKRGYNFLINRILKLADCIIITSPILLIQSEILKKYKDKVFEIPLSYDQSLCFNALPRKFPLSRKFRILFVGKLRKYKGLNFLIDAVKDLDIQLSIVGSGEEEIYLTELVANYNIQNKIFFAKDLNNLQLQQIYRESDLFVLPSINEAEAFGVVQLEAMANGIPVINTKLNSGVPFVSIHEYSGLTVQPSNSIQLKNAILRILQDPVLYEKLSLNALKRSSEFTTEKMLRNYLNVYKSI